MSNNAGTNQVKITGKILYGFDGTNAYPIKVNTEGKVLK